MWSYWPEELPRAMGTEKACHSSHHARPGMTSLFANSTALIVKTTATSTLRVQIPVSRGERDSHQNRKCPTSPGQNPVRFVPALTSASRAIFNVQRGMSTPWYVYSPSLYVQCDRTLAPHKNDPTACEQYARLPAHTAPGKAIMIS